MSVEEQKEYIQHAGFTHCPRFGSLEAKAKKGILCK